MPAYAYILPPNCFVYGRGHRAHRLDVGSTTAHPTDLYWGARTDETLSYTVARRTMEAVNARLGWDKTALLTFLKKVSA